MKSRIQAAQTRAVLAVNRELVRLYRDIGRIVSDRQRQEGWGAAVIPRLALKLKSALPALKGFSERNIKRMLAFHRDYPDQFAATVIASAEVPQAVALLQESFLWAVPWAHHVILMDKVLDLSTRRWYREQTLANGWSRNALSLQIDAHAHARHSKAISDFAAVLPAPQSELARQSLKDPYIFDVKKGEFKPEYAGKLNSYCNVVNDRLRQPTDAPTTGLILCQTRGRLSAEYSVTGIDKPIGISTYELTRALPVQLRSALPTVEEIEAELAPRPPDPTASAASRRS